MKAGIELIAKERQEQIEKHGRTIKEDMEQNADFQLLIGARALLRNDSHSINMGDFPNDWDYPICKRMMNKNYRERLIIAGALIAAELDRLNNDENF